MRTFFILWARELGAWFHAAGTYILLAVFAAVTGLVFWKATEEAVGTPLAPAVLLFGPIYFWLIFIVFTAVIAMHLFAGDRRSGMLEMVLTAPVNEWQLVLAKYAAAMTLLIVACLPLPTYPVMLAGLGNAAGTPVAVPWQPLLTGFAALFLCGAFFNAIGVLCAAILKGSVATGIAVFVVCGLLFVADQTAAVTQTATAARFVNSIAVTPAIQDFTRGIVDTRPLILWVSSTVFCLFAAQRALRLRRITRSE